MNKTLASIACLALASFVVLFSCSDDSGTDPESPAPAPAATVPPDPSIPLSFFFGNLHSHTEYSDGQGTPEQAFDWARDSAGYDFYVVTDHAEMLSASEWDSTGAIADSRNEDGAFVALRGFEWSHPIFGHICVLNTSTYKGAFDMFSPDTFYAWIDSSDGLAQFNHPGREAYVFDTFKYDDDLYDNFFAVETGNNDGEFLPYLNQAIGAGWRVAPTSNQDNHTLSTNSHRTVIIAESLTRAGLLHAIRERRLYSSDDPNMRLSFKSGDYWMGSNIVGSPGRYLFDVSVTDDEPIARIEFLNMAGTVLDTHEPSGSQTSATVTFEASVSSDQCFYVMVYENDSNNDDPAYAEQIAVSAPIWVFPR
ncbi:MAG: hypothetical protein GF331_03885 [Chitinivibrionales bacterium]|nr:hypothetical protein [Chitinivibrionales bacterium]